MQQGRGIRVYLPEALGSRWLEEMAAWERSDGTSRLWQADASLFSGSDEASWLGWLRSPEAIQASPEALGRYRGLADHASALGLDHVLVLGMGGSSLGPEVVSRVWSLSRRAQSELPGRPQLGDTSPLRGLTVLDSTHPATVARVLADIEPITTAVVASSKSGTTLETRLLLDTFWHQFEERLGTAEAARRFVVVTDPGSPLVELAKERAFFDVHLGEPTIGGRFSVLSPFGLVPAALQGIDVEALLAPAVEMAEGCRGNFAADNPGVTLGLLLAASVATGGDKLTLLASPTLQPFGIWLEQLIAESTGKEGKGLLPVDREPLADVSKYGPDRLVVWLRSEIDKGGLTWREQSDLLTALAQEDRPVVWIDVPGSRDLGAEFFRWEVATAVLGARLGLNPFDQPDVEAAKIAARSRAAAMSTSTPGDQGAAETGLALGSDGLWTAYAAPGIDESPLPEASGEAGSDSGLDAALRWLVAGLAPGDLFLIAAWCDASTDATSDAQAELQRMRRLVLRRRGVATSLGFGPRYLHSTGQAHKGGPDGVVALFITDEATVLPVRGEASGGAESYNQVLEAQALGDLEVMAQRGRRVLRVHTSSEDLGKALGALRKTLKRVLKSL